MGVGLRVSRREAVLELTTFRNRSKFKIRQSGGATKPKIFQKFSNFLDFYKYCCREMGTRGRRPTQGQAMHKHSNVRAWRAWRARKGSHRRAPAAIAGNTFARPETGALFIAAVARTAKSENKGRLLQADAHNSSRRSCFMRAHLVNSRAGHGCVRGKSSHLGRR